MCQHLQCIHLSSLCVFAGKQLSAPLAHFCRTTSRSLAGALTFLPVWLADAAPDISRPGACNPFLTQGKNVVGEITWQQARTACAWGLTSRSQQSLPAAQLTHSSPKHWGQAPQGCSGSSLQSLPSPGDLQKPSGRVWLGLGGNNCSWLSAAGGR